MCKQELLTQMKTKESIVIIGQCVEEIIKEKYRKILVKDEIFTLFEKVNDLTNDFFEEDISSQRTDITSMLNLLLSMRKKIVAEQWDYDI